MAIYFVHDIAVEDDGDLSVDNGSLSLATVQESYAHYLLNWTMTTRGSYAFEPTLGWGGEAFVGRLNSPPVHQAMEADFGYAMSLAEDLVASDVTFLVVPVDSEVAALTLNFHGTIVEDDGSSPAEDLVMAFSFPFTTGEIALEIV